MLPPKLKQQWLIVLILLARYCTVRTTSKAMLIYWRRNVTSTACTGHVIFWCDIMQDWYMSLSSPLSYFLDYAWFTLNMRLWLCFAVGQWVYRYSRSVHKSNIACLLGSQPTRKLINDVKAQNKHTPNCPSATGAFIKDSTIIYNCDPCIWAGLTWLRYG